MPFSKKTELVILGVKRITKVNHNCVRCDADVLTNIHIFHQFWRYSAKSAKDGAIHSFRAYQGSLNII